MQDLGIEDHTLFLGWRNDVADILSVMDLFVLPSLNEGMGRALVEAMAMGKAVIATSVGGVPDIVEHGISGVLVPAGNAGQIAIAMVDLLTDGPGRRRLGEIARKRAQSYGVEAMVDRIETLYTDLWNARHT